MPILCLILLSSPFCAVDGRPQSAGSSDLPRLEGVWSFARVEVDGKEQAAVPFATHKMILTRSGEYAVVQGPRVTRGTVKLDVTKTPKHWDVTIATGPQKNVTTQGIYELADDKLRICLPFRNERPKGFASTPGNGLLLFHFKREKHDLKEALTEAAHLELTGAWQAVSYSLDGKKASEEDMKTIKLVVSRDGKTSALQNGKEFIASTITLDVTTTPWAMDIKYRAGYLKGQKSLGIYKVEHDVLTIGRAAPGQPRPTGFVSQPASGHTLMSYRRETAKNK